MEKKKNSFRKDAKKEKEEVCETFEIEKNGKQEVVKACGIEEEKAPTEAQLKKEKKIFIGVGITMIGFILMFAGVFFVIYLNNHFQVDGVSFEIVKQGGQLTLYKTFVPVMYQGKLADYNFYFRTDPRKLTDISFNGVLNMQTNMVLNMTQDFNCDGDGVIAIANLLNVYNVIGTKVMKDDNASCDANGRYMFVKILEGNQTEIKQFGSSCYNIYVKNCDILPSTERYLLETLIGINKKINGK
ncbi:Uncharacterised protein [uncultured archaeon]|nr:Uncharacterised protein [uncultured archaeon]